MVRGLERFRSLTMLSAVGNRGEHQFINGLDVFPVRTRRSYHYLLDDHGAEKTFRSGDVLCDFSDRPAVGTRFEIPLRFGQASGGVQYALFRALQILHGAVAVSLG